MIEGTALVDMIFEIGSEPTAIAYDYFKDSVSKLYSA